MAWDYTYINQVPATGSLAMWQLIARLVAAGWTQQGSGDGSTWSNSGAGPVANGGTGATGLGNSTAWVRLRMPADGHSITREITIQRQSSDVLWTIKYSFSAGFSGGSPSATVAPTASDTQTICSGYYVFPANNTYRNHVVVGGATEGYSFWMGGYATPAGGAPTHCFALDMLASGYFTAEDYDPAVWYCANTPNQAHYALLRTGLGGEAYGALTYLGKLVGGGGSWLAVTAGVATNTSGYSFWAADANSGVGVNPCNAKDAGLFITWCRRFTLATTTGEKGISRLMRAKGSNRVTASTGNFDGGTKNWLLMGDVWLPWGGVDPLI